MMKRCCSLAKRSFFACDRGGRWVGTALHSIFGSGWTLTEHKLVPHMPFKESVSVSENGEKWRILSNFDGCREWWQTLINHHFFGFSRGKWSINGQFSIANLPSRRVFDSTPATFWHATWPRCYTLSSTAILGSSTRRRYSRCILRSFVDSWHWFWWWNQNCGFPYKVGPPR